MLRAGQAKKLPKNLREAGSHVLASTARWVWEPIAAQMDQPSTPAALPQVRVLNMWEASLDVRTTRVQFLARLRAQPSQGLRGC